MTSPKVISVAEFKADFSAALAAVRAGQTVVVAYGRQRRKVAALVPYSAVAPDRKRRLGALAGKATVRLKRNFAITDEELMQP
jgi:antitoxin (DNA-binding transcriptional repressor) of toxin-antitoxin stability system